MTVDNRYKIIRVIGRGGSSCVYLAENIRLHNRLAIKEVYKNGRIVENQNTMLISELSILTKLRHPGLPTIYDVIYTAQSILIVMEYIEGVSLDKHLLQNGACREEDVIKWGKQLCDVLKYLHSQQPPIIYRDMKPANIMLKPDGNVVLIDFGLARERKNQDELETVSLGTRGYAAPEQYDEKRQTDGRTDIYSLGVTLYHLITGNDPCLPPYGINFDYTDNVSPVLVQIIRKCTQLRPADRYQSASELARALGSMQPDRFGPAEEDAETGGKGRWALVLIPIVLIFAIVAIALGVKGGTSSFGPAVAGGVEQEVQITRPDERKDYTFTPEESGFYKFRSISDDELPIFWLFDENNQPLTQDNTRGTQSEFSATYRLTKGVEYHIQTTLYDLNPSVPATGTYWIIVEYIG